MAFSHLIIVCCHAIWLGGPTSGEDEAEWLIEDFQKGEMPTFVEHIRKGVEVLSNDSQAILVFSGGPTKQSKTLLSEARSYKALALARQLFDFPQDIGGQPLEDRIFLDELATDSYQNLLFPMTMFPSCVETLTSGPDVPSSHNSISLASCYPSKISILAHEFKRSRFLSLHAPSIHLPAKEIHFIGIDPPMSPGKRQFVEQGEYKRGFLPWVDDPYGVGGVLMGKRRSRGWTDAAEIEILKGAREESVKRLVEWKGGYNGKEKFLERLPWEDE